MTKTIKVMNANAIRLAADNFADSTAFVLLMQTNNLTDYRINEPVIVNLKQPASVGATLLVLPPTSGIEIGDTLYYNGGYSVVTNVEDQRDTPSSNFCNCDRAGRVIPTEGVLTSTQVDITPGLAAALPTGSSVTFAVSTESPVLIPNPPQPSAQGVPN